MLIVNSFVVCALKNFVRKIILLHISTIAVPTVKDVLHSLGKMGG